MARIHSHSLSVVVQVIVAAQGQRMVGHRMASVLAAHPNIAVTLVPETAVYALMSRVHKVNKCRLAHWCNCLRDLDVIVFNIIMFHRLLERSRQLYAMYLRRDRLCCCVGGVQSPGSHGRWWFHMPSWTFDDHSGCKGIVDHFFYYIYYHSKQYNGDDNVLFLYVTHSLFIVVICPDLN